MLRARPFQLGFHPPAGRGDDRPPSRRYDGGRDIDRAALDPAGLQPGQDLEHSEAEAFVRDR